MTDVFLTEDAEGTTDNGQMSFDSHLTNLQGGSTPYYVRAYAKNEMGVGYGGVEPFETLDNRPEVYTKDADHVTNDTAVIYGTIQSLGASPVKAYFCWDDGSDSELQAGNCPNPTPPNEAGASNITTAPFSFSANFNGLSVGTTTYFQACG